MKFSSRLYTAFGVATALTVALGILAMVQVSRLSAHLHEIGDHLMPGVQALGALKSENREFRTQELQHILSDSAKAKDDYEARMTKTLELIEHHVGAYGKLASSDAERDGLAELRRLQAARLASHMKLREMSRGFRTEEALALARGEIATQRAAIAETLDRLIESAERVAHDEVRSATAFAAFSSVAVPVSILFAVVLGGGLALVIVRVTMRQLGGDPADTKAAVDRIAAGDLVTPIALKAGDTTSLLAALAGMRTNLANIVETIQAGSDEIRTAAQEVSRGNLDLSSRTEQQSSNLQETASALEQITGTIRTTSDSASSADQLARAASETAQRGGEAVDAVVRTMQEIAGSSQRVKDIIGVIDGIAFQTNILALNAAVEAARAGEQGRGFAVVATEVRTLAQRSADAAREIKALIEGSTGKVDEGTALVADAGATMSEVVQSVRRVADIIGEITAAAQEQSSGVAQINEAVGQLDTVTQQNAALVEEAAAATSSMEEQADRLVAAVSVFRTEAGTGRAATASHAPARLSAPSRPGAAAAGRPTTVQSASVQKPKAAPGAPADESWQSF